MIQKALGKLDKMCGGDALEHRWYEHPLYEFTFEKETGSVTVEGGAFQWEQGDAVIYILDDDTWTRRTVYPANNTGLASKPVFAGSNCGVEVGRVSGVVDHHKEPIGRLEWDLTVDLAAGDVVDVERQKVRDGKVKSDRYRSVVED
jgi:hypothetical protein